MRIKINLFCAAILASILALSAGAYGQGSIFGSVMNANDSIPADNEITFFGYLDDTDEEIRIDLSTGAGYDGGNWYDDFQNYLTEAPGNPYDYHFYNSANGEGTMLSNPIPDNSFQQEDIVLADVTWPATPTGLRVKEISETEITISWDYVPGLTYHVYRRLLSSNGSFFRIDDPSGSPANPGVADSNYIDTEIDTGSHYDYLLIAENDAGNLSPRSAILDTEIPEFLCGDADGNGVVNISDAVFLLGYIFGGGPPPEPLQAADADCSDVVNVADVVYLISYIFAVGPPPCNNCP
jgi:hypothetical protein